jgi:uncharacterized protein YkwD
MRRALRTSTWILCALGLVLGLALASTAVPVGHAVSTAPSAEAARQAVAPGTVRLKRTTVKPGATVKLSGRVAHGPRKVRVQLRSAGGRWRDVTGRRSKRSGKFKASFVAPSRAGKYQVRALAPRAKVRGKSRGKVVTRAARFTVRQAGGSLPVRAQESAVLDRANAERAKAGCAPLRWSSRLHVAARGHSEDMARSGNLSHTGSDGSTMRERIDAAGYRWSKIGENVAAGQPTAAQVVADWMTSPTHRANILDCDFVHLGVGFARNSGGTAYWTQDFGRPF